MQPREAPRPLYAEFHVASLTLTVWFDKLLVDGPVLRFNWRVHDGLNLHFQIAGVGIAAMRTVTVPLLAVLPDLTAIGVDYSAVIPDVIGRNGLPVAPFTGFPITLV